MAYRTNQAIVLCSGHPLDLEPARAAINHPVMVKEENGALVD